MTTPIDQAMRALDETASEAERDAQRQRRLARPEDYVYDKAQEAFWDVVDGTLHSEKSVDASIPQGFWRVVVEEGDDPDAPRSRGRPRQRRERLVQPSKDIMRVENDQFVEASTWWPGMPRIIEDFMMSDSGPYREPQRRLFNSFRPVPRPQGNPADAQPWLDHLKKLFGHEPKALEDFLNCCAHMVQHPETKVQWGVLVCGGQGVGKDAALKPVAMAVGEWNVKGIDPDALLSDFNPWVKAVMLVVNEIRPSKDGHKLSDIYNKLKPLMADTASPVIAMNQKFQKAVYVINVLRVFMTTNHPLALRLEEDDRRTLVLEATLPEQWHHLESDPWYFDRYYRWLNVEGGAAAVSAFLHARDLSDFKPGDAPTKTAAWHRIVNSWASDDALSRVLASVPNEYAKDGTPSAECGRPRVVFAAELLLHAFDDREELEKLLQAKRLRAHAIEGAGFYELQRPEGGPWRSTVEGFEFKSRMALVDRRMRDQDGEAACVAAARARLVGLAAWAKKADKAAAASAAKHGS